MSNNGIRAGTANSEGQQRRPTAKANSEGQQRRPTRKKGTVGQDDVGIVGTVGVVGIPLRPPKILFVMAHSLWHFPGLSKHSEPWHMQ
jgi:hypothetical protein